MAIYARLDDGTRLKFPDGTSEQDISIAVEEYLSSQETPNASASGGNVAPTAPTEQEQPMASPTKQWDWNEALSGIPGFVEGAAKGVARIGTGLQQRATELLPNGVTPALYRNVLSAAYPELAEELKNLSDDDLIAAQSRVGQRLDAGEEDPLSQKIGQLAGEVAPTLAAGAGRGLIAGGLIGGATMGALQPTNAQTVGESQQQNIENTLLGGTLGVATGGALKGAGALVSNARPIASRLLRANPQALEDIRASGVPESIGAVTDSPTVKLVDQFLAKFPGSAGVIQKNVQQTISSIQDDLGNLGARQISAEEAGEAIKGGAQAYRERFFDVADKLYQRLYRSIPADEKFAVSNTRGLIDDLAKENQYSTGVMEEVASSSPYRMVQKLLNDAKDGSIAYKGLEKYRSAIGASLKKPQLMSGAEEGLARRIYGALTQDMRAAAASKGEKALQQFDNANQFYALGAKNIKDNLEPIISKKYPEQIFQAAMSGSKVGGTKISSIMRSLPQEQREIVWGATLNNLGKANPSSQNVAGDVFSLDTLLTRWNQMPDSTKKALMSGAPEGVGPALETVLRRAERYKGLAEYSSRSGTGQQSNMGIFLLGSLLQLPKAVGAVGGAYGTSRLMTSPGFVKWLAGATSAKGEGTIAFKLRRLRDVAKNEPEIAEDITRYLGNIEANLLTSHSQ